jgi:hypothetical protein
VRGPVALAGDASTAPSPVGVAEPGPVGPLGPVPVEGEGAESERAESELAESQAGGELAESQAEPSEKGPLEAVTVENEALEVVTVEIGLVEGLPVETVASQTGPAPDAAAPGGATPGAGSYALNPTIDLMHVQRHVRGQVTAANGEPLAGASVTLVHPNGDEVGHTTTAEDGSFDLSDIDEGTYTLVAAAPHYRPAARVVALGHGETRALVSLLGVGALVVRIARARDHVPVSAELELFNADGGLAAQCETGEDGVSILPDLLEGSYELVVRRDNYSPATGPVVVRRGRTGTAEVQLVGLGHLYGAVIDADGGWLPDQEVTLVDPSGDVVAVTRTDGAGSYLFRAVAEGSYTVSVGAREAAVTVDIGAGTAALADLRVPATIALQTPPPPVYPAAVIESEVLSAKKDG